MANNIKKKYNFILDLDETLISSEATEEYDFVKYEKKSKKFNFETMEDFYIIFQRPHLQEFLDFIFENFNVCIWTAASKDYALFIINKIILYKPTRKIDYIFFSYHCTLSRKIKKGKSKDLSIMWDFFKIKGYNKDNTVIFDDYDEVYNTQKENCIIVKPFKFTENKSEKDKFLKKIIPKIKKHLLTNNTINTQNINKEII